MSQRPTPLEDEDTNVFVRRVRHATRRKRRLVVGSLLLVPALLVFWVITGRESCKARFRSDMLGEAAFPKKPKEKQPEVSWVVNPGATTAKVFVTLSEPGLLWLDNTPLGPSANRTLELTPGTHIVRAEVRTVMMQQTLTAKAGEEFRLRFDREKKDVILERVPPP